MLIAIWSAIRKYVFPFVGFSERTGTDPAPRKPFRRLWINDPPELRLATVAGGSDFCGSECDRACFHGFSSSGSIRNSHSNAIIGGGAINR
jgi:hypothetical protein